MDVCTSTNRRQELTPIFGCWCGRTAGRNRARPGRASTSAGGSRRRPLAGGGGPTHPRTRLPIATLGPGTTPRCNDSLKPPSPTGHPKRRRKDPASRDEAGETVVGAEELTAAGGCGGELIAVVFFGPTHRCSRRPAARRHGDSDEGPAHDARARVSTTRERRYLFCPPK